MKILYLYNKENWALHNVGKLWFSELPEDIKVTMENYHAIDNPVEYFNQFDFIWFSYLYMYMKFNYDVSKSIVSIHDPMEVFPQIKDWKNALPLEENLLVLKRLKYVNTISSELKSILEDKGIKLNLIFTNSLLPEIDKNKIIDKELSITSIATEYPRKDFPLLFKIRNFCLQNNININLKVDGSVSSDEEYIKFIDNNSVYICTSYQEGGPLPAMDAMKRGLVVLTTPVGQMTEIIEDGVSGFICSLEQDFNDKITYLKNNSDKLLEMREKSLESIRIKRNKNLIKGQVLNFLYTLK